MDLDAMKQVWAQMSERIEEQEKISKEIILNMAKAESGNRLKKLIYLQVLAMGWYVVVIVYITLNFYQLNTPLSLTAGIITIFLLLVMLGVGVDYIRKANKISIADNNYRQALLYFNKWKKSYHFNGFLAYCLALAILISIAPVVFKINRGAEITQIPLAHLLGYALFASIGSVISSYLFFKYYYARQLTKINQILRELEAQ